MGQDAVLNAMIITLGFFLRVIVLYVYWALNSRKSILLLWNFQTFLIPVSMIIFFHSFMWDNHLNISVKIRKWSLGCLWHITRTYFSRLHLASFFFFQRFYFFLFLSKAPPVHSCIFLVVGPASCGMCVRPQHGLTSGAMSTPRIGTGKTLGCRSRVHELNHSATGSAPGEDFLKRLLYSLLIFL